MIKWKQKSFCDMASGVEPACPLKMRTISTNMMNQSKLIAIVMTGLGFGCFAVPAPEQSGFLLAIGLCFAVIGITHRLRTLKTREFHRLLILGSALLITSIPILAMADGAVSSLDQLKTALGNGIGLLMLVIIPVGVAMIIRGIIMDKSHGEWKMEIVKGLVLVAAPAIMSLLFKVFMGTDSGVTPAFGSF
jgi:hypothetical protein